VRTLSRVALATANHQHLSTNLANIEWCATKKDIHLITLHNVVIIGAKL
jgi:hypothetical protein